MLLKIGENELGKIDFSSNECFLDLLETLQNYAAKCRRGHSFSLVLFNSTANLEAEHPDPFFVLWTYTRIV